MSLTLKRGYEVGEQLSSDPLVWVVDDFVTELERQHVMEIAARRMSEAKVSRFGTKEVSAKRTGSVAWVKHDQTPIVGDLVKRVSGLVGLPADHSESLQVVHYGETQEYRQHYDAWDINTAKGREKTAIGGKSCDHGADVSQPGRRRRRYQVPQAGHRGRGDSGPDVHLPRPVRRFRRTPRRCAAWRDAGAERREVGLQSVVPRNIATRRRRRRPSRIARHPGIREPPGRTASDSARPARSGAERNSRRRIVASQSPVTCARTQ